MIIPFLDGIRNFRTAPVTWILVLFNIFIFAQTYNLSQQCQEKFQDWYKDESFLYTQGQVYKQHLGSRELASAQSVELLGKLAFRDVDFLNVAMVSPWKGDQVAIETWKKDLQSFLSLRDFYPPTMFGVSAENRSLLALVSYQFYHEGFMHLLGNILLVLLIGGFLEKRYSGTLVFAVYIFGGISAALLFSHFAGDGAPLVGASGSLCALIGFLFYSHFNEKTRLVFMVLPAKGYYGSIMVPTVYWVLWLCMIEDVAGWLGKPGFFPGGVAHLVHLLGFCFGVLVAYFFKLAMKKTKNIPLTSDLV